jgi:hypothetical protein
MEKYTPEQLEKGRRLQELVNQASDRLRVRGREFVSQDESEHTKPSIPSVNSGTPTRVTTRSHSSATRPTNT